MKIYVKRGKKNYKENRLLKEIESALAEKLEKDPTLASKIVPATNMEELKAMHTKFTGEDVEFEEIENPKQETVMSKKNKDDIEEVDTSDVVEAEDIGNDDSQFVDPFNREEPIVREYVYGDDSLGKNQHIPKEGKTSFDEPLSFDEAFVIPDGIEEEEKEQTKSSSSSNKTETTKSESKEKKEPLNPAFDDMSSGKKKRSTKKFAKYIVEAICTLSEKGFVWFANKDINDSKLAEYEMSGEMDLSLLVTLDDGQEVSVKQFFQSQCLKAEEMSKISEEQKSDLADALGEVLMEKGVGPTPTQELILITLTVLGGQAITLMTLKSQTNGLLVQLRAMNEEYVEPARAEYTPPQQSEVATPQETVVEDEGDFESLPDKIESPVVPEVVVEDNEVINEPIETKE